MKEWQGFWLAAIATFLLSLKGIFAKLAYMEGASIDAVLLLRFFICIPFVWLYLIFRGKISLLSKLRAKDLVFFFALAFFGYYLGSKFDFIAIDTIGVSLSRILLLTYPIIVVIVNIFLYRRLPPIEQIIAVILCQIGAVIVIGASPAELLSINLSGSVFSLLSALAYAIYVVSIERYGKSFDSQYLVAWVVTIASFYIFVDFIFTNDLGELVMTPAGYFWTTMIAIFSTALPLTLIAEVIKKVGSNKSAIFSALGPIFTILVAFLVFGETLTLFQIFGALVIIGSVQWMINKKQKQ